MCEKVLSAMGKMQKEKLLFGSSVTVTKENLEEVTSDTFIKKLEELYPSIQYVNRLMTHSWGQKVIRFYDLDGNLIEVGTPV